MICYITNSLLPSDAILVTWNWINIGSGKGLLPDSTKPLPELMLTYSDNVLKRHMTQCLYVSVNWVIIGSGNGLSPVLGYVITWTNPAN